MSRLGLPEDHTHDPADAIEHFISAELAVELAVELGAEVGDERDPQGKEIPPSSA
ncbi:MAG: iron dependent repressor, metal binding and dimerization domain protein [Candidatus Latescibacteria bacterium]|jgi:Mn-dependent DtxR family transcriptional regulator|nr:iron dependent repressor, metal binding and dimerization domain protein [Candidatus Latescibacterota bacterium]